MNSTELMELIERRDKLTITFDDSITEQAREKFLADVNREIYYGGQERKAMALVWLWLKWVVLPIVVALLIYGVIYAVLLLISYIST